MGFEGSRNLYLLPDDAAWRQLGIQGSVKNGGGLSRFTINLHVIGREEWAGLVAADASLPPRPNPTVHWNVGTAARIGLLATGTDTWWEVRADTKLTRLADEVLAMVREVGVPFLLG